MAKKLPRGLSGILNMGNTCYMNAAIQVLANTDIFLAYMIGEESPIKHHIMNRTLDKYVEDEDKKNNERHESIDFDDDELEQISQHKVTNELRRLLKKMWENNCEIRPDKLRRSIATHMPYFRSNHQHDAQEFFNALLDIIHEETHGKGVVMMSHTHEENEVLEQLEKLTGKELIEFKNKNSEIYLRLESQNAWKKNIEHSYSTITDIFSSLMLTTIRCNECQNCSYCFERSDILALCLDPNNPDNAIEDLLKKSIEPEILSESNEYFCAYCEKKRSVAKTTSMYYFPDKLVIMLKKYNSDGQGGVTKNNQSVTYPHQLDMTPYINPLRQTEDKPLYELYAAIHHSGSHRSGHYYTYAKSPINQEWHCFDDESVYHVSADDVLRSNNYLLFYQLKH